MKTTLVIPKAMLVAAIFCTSLTSAYAQPKHMNDSCPMGKEMHMMHKEMGNMPEHRFEIPGLTAEQKDQIKKIETKFAQTTLPTRNLLNEKQAHLKTLLSAANTDQKAINETIDEIGKLRNELFKQQVYKKMEIRKLLTDEQKVAFDSRPHGKRGEGFKHRR